MKHKKGWIAGIMVVAVIVLLFVGYNIYRYPAMFRRLSDNSLSDSQVEKMQEEILSQSDVKVLVAYFSYSGTTKTVATALSQKTGGDLFEITPQTAYSNVYMQSNSEIRSNAHPALADTVENMEEYDVVFVGYPVWWHATPAPINSFLESYDLTGKLIIPFCTSGESDISETMPKFLNSCDGLAVFGQKRISSSNQIDAWLEELQLNFNTQEIVETSEVSETSGVPETTLSEVSDVNGKTLVVYFSWSSSGNTEKMVSQIQEQTGGDLLALEPLNPYPTDYNECGEVAKAEKDENARPEIANLPESISEYDTIFIGYPIWWHTAPMIIGTFLENYDLSGVEIYPFSQSASMDTEQFHNSMEFVREIAVGANVHDGLFVKAEDTNGIQEYLKTNILKGRYTVVRMLQTILAIAILLCMMGSMISGIILSRHVFTFLSIRGGQSWARTMHLLSSYWGFVLMNLHLGVHWSMMIGMIKKYLGALSPKQTWLLRAVAVAIAIYGVFAFAHREIGGYLFLKNEFVFFNFEEPLILFFLDYIAVMGFFVFVGYYFTIFLKWYGRKKAI